MDEQLKNLESVLGDLQEVKSNWISWGKVGDYVRGTLTSIREIASMLPGKEGERVKVYEILTECGQFHPINEDKTIKDTPTVLNKGEYWQVSGKPVIDNQMRNIRIGQIIGLVFADTKPAKTKGFNPVKIIKVRVGGMDPNYNGQSDSLPDVPSFE